VLVEGHDAVSGNEEMRQAYALWTSTGTVLTTPFYLALRAEGLALGGHPEEGIELLDQALAVIERCGERYYEAEVRRLYGTLVRQCATRAGIDRDEEAESWLRGALASAQSRELLSLSLRAAISLAQLWRSCGRHGPAHQVLDDAYRCIEEGAETRDLVHARELLAELRGALPL
jgi:predicted ATPase